MEISRLNPGVWGTPTSTIDWCELNYRHTPYVAEFFNTVSSLAMPVAGGLGLLLHWEVLERRFLLAYFIVCIVGIGSVAFHATLRFEWQLLDELPMLYSALVIVYIFLENRPKRRFGMWFPAALLAWTCIVTRLTALFRGQLQFYAFQLSFGSLECFALYRIYRMARSARHPLAWPLFKTGMGFYGTAIALWFVDIRFCESLQRLPFGLPNPELHALGHVLVSTGLYLLVLLVALDRAETLGQSRQLRRAGQVLPHLAASARVPGFHSS